METVVILGSLGSVSIAASFILYTLFAVHGKTKPHVFTWLIWTITHGLAASAVFDGGGGWFAALPLFFAAGLSLFIVFLGLKYGSLTVTKLDIAALAAASAAILIWWKLDNPVLAVMIVAIIDLIGFIPTYRQSLHNPYTEPLSTWILYIIGNCLALTALSVYNVETTFYISTMIAASTLLTFIIVKKRYF